MTYDSSKEELTLIYKRTKQIRSYNAKREIAYKLFYCKSAAECMKVFSTEIKGKLQVITVKNI